jgi:hypothetical protein
MKYYHNFAAYLLSFCWVHNVYCYWEPTEYFLVKETKFVLYLQQLRSIMFVLVGLASPPPPWLYSPWKDLGHLTHGGVVNLISTLGRTPLNEWPARRKGLYLHMTSQYRKTRTIIYALSGIRIHDLSFQAIKACASDHAVTGTCLLTLLLRKLIFALQYFVNIIYFKMSASF